jgi:hypothetical protein
LSDEHVVGSASPYTTCKCGSAPEFVSSLQNAPPSGKSALPLVNPNSSKLICVQKDHVQPVCMSV